MATDKCKTKQISWLLTIGVMLTALLWFNVPMCQGSDDIDPVEHNWDTYDGWAVFYVLDPYGEGYLTGTKYILADTNLISAHCETHESTDIAHIHYEDDFTVSSTRDHDDSYWDWYFDEENDPDITRLNHSTNTTESFAYMLNTWTNGTYGYWVVHGDGANESDTIFSDDLDVDTAPVAVNHFLLFTNSETTDDVVARVSAVDGNGDPERLRWKIEYGPEYVLDNDEMEDRYTIPCRDPLDEKIGDPPTGTLGWWPDATIYDEN